MTLFQKNFKNSLDKLYLQYNKRSFAHPDPVTFLYDYPDLRDREIVGLIASTLAYGNVKQIFKSVRFVLDRLSKSPYSFLVGNSERDIKLKLSGFYHRFTKAEDLCHLLNGIKKSIQTYGSLQACFLDGFGKNDSSIFPALASFTRKIVGDYSCAGSALLPDVSKGSACKRLHLYLRWMVREDEIDLGGWKHISPSKLIVPLDTHMHRISLKWQATKRKQANMKTALEVTEFFSKISPTDPVKYDFVLTNLAMRGKLVIDF